MVGSSAPEDRRVGMVCMRAQKGVFLGPCSLGPDTVLSLEAQTPLLKSNPCLSVEGKRQLTYE